MLLCEPCDIAEALTTMASGQADLCGQSAKVQHTEDSVPGWNDQEIKGYFQSVVQQFSTFYLPIDQLIPIGASQLALDDGIQSIVN